MAREYLTYWKCRHCFGSGKIIICGRVSPCGACDGTGNAMVDGEAADHARRIAAVEAEALEREGKP